MSGSLPPTFVKGFHDEASVRRMEYRTLGSTGLRVSKIALGGAALSKLFGDSFNKEEAIRTVHQALKSGVNYIDTAPFYGQGVSEKVLGEVLKDVPREAFYISTKVGRYELDPKLMFDYTAAKTRASVEKSLQLLGLDYVDLVQVHDADAAPNQEIVLDETIPVLEEYKRVHKVRHIGITGYDVDVLKEIAERGKGRVETILSYARYTLHDNTLLQHMKTFKELNVGVICAAAHSMGLLTNGGPQNWHPGSAELKELAARAVEICKKRNVELGKLAMYFTMQLDDAATFVIGMNTCEVLQLNLNVIFDGLSDEEHQVLDYLRGTIFTDNHSWGATTTTINTFSN